MATRAVLLGVTLLACTADAPPTTNPPPEDSPFAEAPHPPARLVPFNGGATLASPKIAVVTFAGYSFADDIEAMADFIPTSQWLGAVSSGYGVGAPSAVAKVRLAEAAPAFSSASDFTAYVASKVATLAPADFYAFVFPIGASFSDPSIGTLCNEFSGYHDASSTYTFAAIGTCPNHVAGLADREQAERVLSHELVEAMTNPYGDGWVARDPEDPWSYVEGGEVADVCNGVVREGGFVFTRSWSNVAASAGADPCQPTDAPTYFDVSPSSLDVQHVAAGASVSLELTGFSTAKTTDWVLHDFPGRRDFVPNVALGASEMNNAETTSLTITVPASTAPGSTAVLLVRSYHAGDASYALEPIVVRTE